MLLRTLAAAWALQSMRAVFGAKSSSGIGGLPGEDYYVEKTLPNDLSYAAMIGDVSSARRVISFGVDVNARDKEGLTPLLRAVMYGNIEVLRLLLEHGADASIRGADDYPGEAGLIAVHAAAWAGREDIYSLLLDGGADPTVLSTNGYSVLHRVGASKADGANHTALWELIIAGGHSALDAVAESDGKTCLHLAAATGMVKFVDAVLAAIEDETDRKRLVNLPDEEGQTALHIAANRTVYFEPPEGVNENTTFQVITQMAFESQMAMSIMQALSRAGADPMIPDKNGRTVADLAEGISTATSQLPPTGRNPTAAERVAMGMDPTNVDLKDQSYGDSKPQKKKTKKKKNKRRYDDDFDL